jgi:peptidoglycan/LPS O-acetylase OafA/YrhL
MYLVLPALYLLVERAGRRAALQVGLLWLGSVAIVLVLWRTGHNYQLIKFFPCFLPGVLAFCLRGIRRRLVPALLFAYVLATAFAMSWAVNHGLTETATAWPICLVLGVLIPACRELKPLWLRWAGKTIAKYSYGIYLMHGICVHLAFELWKHKPPVLQWACFFGTLVPLVGAAYHFIEKPGIDLGRRLAARLEQRNSRTSPLTASMPGSET